MFLWRRSPWLMLKLKANWHQKTWVVLKLTLCEWHLLTLFSFFCISGSLSTNDIHECFHCQSALAVCILQFGAKYNKGTIHWHSLKNKSRMNIMPYLCWPLELSPMMHFIGKSTKVFKIISCVSTLSLEEAFRKLVKKASFMKLYWTGNTKLLTTP